MTKACGSLSVFPEADFDSFRVKFYQTMAGIWIRDAFEQDLRTFELPSDKTFAGLGEGGFLTSQGFALFQACKAARQALSPGVKLVGTE
jgi:hypothetical protein